MQEKLLQFIWQYSLYRPNGLITTSGQPIQIIRSGTLNRDSGPDFSNARIRIGQTLLAGNIELHVRTSDWARHKHSSDAAYRNIILHVVFEHDAGGSPAGIPLLELKQHIPPYVLQQYAGLLQTTTHIPCQQHLSTLSGIIKESWLSRLLAERWEAKLEGWKLSLQQCDGIWQSLLYKKLAENFGFKTNAAPFKMLADSLPLSIIQKQSSIHSIEALLFGQAGMLDDETEEPYRHSLKLEYAYQKNKYKLTSLAPHLWKFLRMRPANFPTIRIAQFAALMKNVTDVFRRIEAGAGVNELVALLNVTASEYWNNHYHFGEAHAKQTVKKLGTASAQNIVMNTIAPALFLYANMQGNYKDQERALELLDKIPPEDNHILRLWSGLGWKPVNAGQSQAQIQLFNHYCAPKRCLECAFGLKIIRSSGPDKDN